MISRPIKHALTLLIFPVLAGGAMQRPAGDGKIDFQHEIEPILRTSCYSCHGPEKQGAGLRLDDRAAALKGGLSGPVILPGKAEQSTLYRRIAGLDQGARMPLEGDGLSTQQIERIRTWIHQGASWPEGPGAQASQTKETAKHWAYVPPRQPDPPAVRKTGWVRNPIDNFVLARLEREGLAPQPEASRETLIRRLSLDLIGLPPAPAEIDTFLADADADAYEKLVDRLLASPRYGERWARPWLDLARYADTNGYEKDDRRKIWLYRDWVIDALNRDLPYDQFTIEQIAGDLLPNATDDQKIATGFHRNTMINEEGGVDPEEFRVAAVVDRVDTTATVWLGTTLGCAQCHNHKFDPFSQEEFYRFFAYFNNSEEDVNTLPGSERGSRGPNFTIPASRRFAPHRKQVEEQILSLEERLDQESPELDAAQAAWEREGAESLVSWRVLQPSRAVSVAGATLEPLEDQSIMAQGKIPAQDSYVVTTETDQTGITAVRLEALMHAGLPNGGFSRSQNGNFILTGFEVEIAPAGARERSQAVRFVDAFAQHGTNVKNALDGDPARGWSVRVDRMRALEDTQAVFAAENPFGFAGGTRITVRLKHESALAAQSIGRFRLSITTEKGAGKSVRIPVRIQSILAIPATERSGRQLEQLRAHYRSIAPKLESLREALSSARSLWADLAQPATMVVKELPEPRKTYVHIRGSFLSKGKQVTPGVPSVLHPLPEGASSDRLTLARWLVDPVNPLAARVAVNRIWAQYFGRGIVDTEEDFGSQGQLPSHPELLDWLATEFVQQKWSRKALHRLIVTSAAYRQSSRVTDDLLQRDPANRLFARGSRLRLEAEMIRDNALAIAGLLSSKMFGPSVFPPQPAGIWNLVYNDDKWIESAGEDRYRRGIYTFWRRTAPHPSFMTFDAPSRELICTRRTATNTPLQALTTLNDPVFFDAARGLARRILIEAPSDPLEGIRYGFRLCTARRPSTEESDRLLRLFEEELGNFQRNPKAAEELATGGGVARPDGCDTGRFAAWTVLANVLLNLNETLTKG